MHCTQSVVGLNRSVIKAKSPVAFWIFKSDLEIAELAPDKGPHTKLFSAYLENTLNGEKV
jgi:hypothetical protein